MEEPASKETAPKTPKSLTVLFVITLLYTFGLIVRIHQLHDGAWSAAMGTFGTRLPRATQFALDCIPHLYGLYAIGSVCIVAVHLRIKSVRRRSVIYLVYILVWQSFVAFLTWALWIPINMMQDFGNHIR